LGASINFLSEELFEKLSTAKCGLAAHDWRRRFRQHVGLDEEPKWKLMRLERLQYGSIFLTDVPMVDFPKDRMTFLRRALESTPSA